jgi:cell division protein FtsI (penicillin-binding protein 3)
MVAAWPDSSSPTTTGCRGHTGKKRYIKDLHGDAVRDIGVVEEARPGAACSCPSICACSTSSTASWTGPPPSPGADAGVIVTLDSHSGEVLASASYPDFNPNNRSGVTMERTRNRAMTDVFEPGSTMKPLTLVAALESGQLHDGHAYRYQPGRIRVGRKVLPDPRNYGEITLLAWSRSPARWVSPRWPWISATSRSGRCSSVSVSGAARRRASPARAPGLLPQRPRWRPIEEVTLAFGYGLTATPLQLARAYAVFAGGGVLPEVSLLRRDAGAYPGQRVIDPHVARDVLGVLARGDRRRRHGRIAPGCRATPSAARPARCTRWAGGYLDDQYVALFVGMAPIDAPRFVTVVVLDRPKGDSYGGGAAAAPVFARVAGETLRLLGVPRAAPECAGEVLAGGAP